MNQSCISALAGLFTETSTMLERPLILCWAFGHVGGIGPERSFDIEVTLPVTNLGREGIASAHLDATREIPR